MAEAGRLAHRDLEQLLGLGAERQRRHLLAAGLVHVLHDAGELLVAQPAATTESPAARSVLVAEDAEQQVWRIDPVVTAVARGDLGFRDDLAGFPGEALDHRPRHRRRRRPAA